MGTIKSASLLVLLQACLLSVQSQVLELITLNTKLPSTRSSMPVAYDGGDNIYTWGGRYSGGYWRNDILKFSISQETIEQIGSDRERVELGSGVWTGDTLLYIGGCAASGSGKCYDDIWSFDPSNASNWTTVANLPKEIYWSTSIWDGKDQTFVIGGDSFSSGTLPSIYAYSSARNEIQEMASLPSRRQQHSAALFNGNIYIFGGRSSSSSGYLNEIVKHNPVDNTTTLLTARLPVQIGFTCAVSTPDYIYLIGGNTNTANEWPPIIRFDPETEEVVSLEAINFPDKLYAAGCAFVESKNRIYIFGGYANGTYRDQIMYISLAEGPEPTTTWSTSPTTEDPPITTTNKPITPVDCVGQDDGTLLPNPYCCESFYQCVNWEAVIQHCPSQLQFNPQRKVCDFRNVVRCGIVYGV